MALWPIWIVSITILEPCSIIIENKDHRNRTTAILLQPDNQKGSIMDEWQVVTNNMDTLGDRMTQFLCRRKQYDTEFHWTTQTSTHFSEHGNCFFSYCSQLYITETKESEVAGDSYTLRKLWNYHYNGKNHRYKKSHSKDKWEMIGLCCCCCFCCCCGWWYF